MSDAPQEPPSLIHKRMRIAMVAPPWYEIPPVGYGGLEVITAALVDGLVGRGHEVTLFGAGNRTGTRARFVSTSGQLQYPRLGELIPAVMGPDLAVEACKAARVPLVLAGKCGGEPERRYLDEELRPRLDDSIELMVNPDRPATRRLLHEARCLIMPIRWSEPFGMVMIEAMAVGTPVVALRCGAVPELVRHGVTGWIADCAEELPDLLHRGGEIDAAECTRHVRTNFSAAVMAGRYERVYVEALGRPAPAVVHRRRLVDRRPTGGPILRRGDRRLPHLR